MEFRRMPIRVHRCETKGCCKNHKFQMKRLQDKTAFSWKSPTPDGRGEKVDIMLKSQKKGEFSSLNVTYPSWIHVCEHWFLTAGAWFEGCRTFRRWNLTEESGH